MEFEVTSASMAVIVLLTSTSSAGEKGLPLSRHFFFVFAMEVVKFVPTTTEFWSSWKSGLSTADIGSVERDLRLLSTCLIKRLMESPSRDGGHSLPAGKFIPWTGFVELRGVAEVVVGVGVDTASGLGLASAAPWRREMMQNAMSRGWDVQ